MQTPDCVATFIAEHDLAAPPAYRLLDLVSEVGEVANDAVKTTAYGRDPTDLDIAADEIGDVLFATYALADALDIDADAALTTSLEKYRTRIEATNHPGSDA